MTEPRKINVMTSCRVQSRFMATFFESLHNAEEEQRICRRA